MLPDVLVNWIQLEHTQWMKPNALSQIQTKRLKKIVNHAYRNVPFYHDLYATRPDVFDEINLNNFTQLPRTTRAQLRSVPLISRAATNVDVNSCLPLTTSGATGTPLTILDDPHSAACRDALNLRMLWEYGVRPFDRICRVRLGTRPELRIALAAKKGPWGWLRRRFHRILLSNEDISRQIEFFANWKPRVLIASASYCKILLTQLEQTGKALTFGMVITTAEMSDRATRKRIEGQLSAMVYDHYGIEEVGSLAWECPTHAGYHVNSDSVIVELLRDSLQRSDDESGEVHVTAFHQIATPIIRYSVGDVATSIPDDCSCGRGLMRITGVQGRKLDFILRADGHYVSPLGVITALEDLADLEWYKVIQHKDLSIEILMSSASASSNRTKKETEKRCRELFGETPLQIRIVKELREGSGQKRRQVVSFATA